MFAIIKAEYDSNRDSVCVIDGKPVNKGDKVVLLGDKVRGQQITNWQVAHIAPKCADKVENWIAKQPGTATAAPPSPKGYGQLDSIDKAFRLIAAGNKERDSKLQGLGEFVEIHTKTLATLISRIAAIEDVVRLPESSQSNPARPAADSENKPVNCLGIKTNGQACQQTQNRLNDRGFCYAHRGQSGDSERAKLDKHADEVKAAAEEDRPAVSQDTLELLS